MTNIFFSIDADQWLGVLPVLSLTKYFNLTDMDIKELCVRETVITTEKETAFDAAKLMKQYNVGCLVVVKEGKGGNVPLGLITDRDIAIKVTAEDIPPKDTTIDQVMSRDILTIPESADLYEALKKIRFKGVRRAPVVDKSGFLVGIITFDDILEAISKELNEIVQVFQKEQPVIA